MLICVVHKLTIGFAVLGVINGVILQETFKVAATDDVIMVRQKKRTGEIAKQKMRILFEALDVTGDGTLDYEEFKIISVDPEVKTWLASMDIETDDLQTLFNLIDSDGKGGVTIDELSTRMPRIKGTARSIDVLAMRHRLNEVTNVLNVHSERLISMSSAPLEMLKPEIAAPLVMLKPEIVTIGGAYNDIPQAKDLLKTRDSRN